MNALLPTLVLRLAKVLGKRLTLETPNNLPYAQHRLSKVREQAAAFLACSAKNQAVAGPVSSGQIRADKHLSLIHI